MNSDSPAPEGALSFPSHDAALRYAQDALLRRAAYLRYVGDEKGYLDLWNGAGLVSYLRSVNPDGLYVVSERAVHDEVADDVKLVNEEIERLISTLGPRRRPTATEILNSGGGTLSFASAEELAAFLEQLKAEGVHIVEAQSPEEFTRILAEGEAESLARRAVDQGAVGPGLSKGNH
jgi:hypothetical protein